MLWPAPHGFMGITEHLVEAVDLDGTSDFANRGADLDMADGEDFLASLWFNIQGGNGADRYMIAAANTRVGVYRNSSNKIFVSFLNSSGGGLGSFQSTASFTDAANTGWHHLLVAAELDVSPVLQVYLDDAALAGTNPSAPANGNIDLTQTDWDVGQRSDNSRRFFGFLSEVWFTDTYIDITVEANRRKFITAGLKPVNLGLDGSIPTGAQPSAYFRQAAPDWEANQGSGGGFTENGTLGAAASSPSD